MPADPPPRRNLPVGLMVVGSEMATFTILGVLLDLGLGTMPGFTIGLTILGVGLAFWHLIKISKALAERKPPSNNQGSP
ncbi:MAG: hypothetical protein L0241_23105 [Planctomycetia bacterium]|nr:hypothetical protein [Planctomycetia bacterium]